MGVQKVEINQFLAHAAFHPVLDVRSPGEYFHAHIPGARSFPLFTDEERKVVGTLYKQRSREEAIKQGLNFFGPRMRSMIEEVETIISSINYKKVNTDHPDFVSENCVLVHCWRGGMRSGAIAWLLDLYGFKVISLQGGYKTFRKYVLGLFELQVNGQVLGGFTGSGKSVVLHQLKKKGQSVIDLEGIARHKGSAFGAIGQPPQPTQEMFENFLAMELRKVHEQKLHPWFEDESQRIGSVNIPITFWNNLRKLPVYFLEVPFEQRLDYIVKEYGGLDTEKLINAIIRISKRLGGLETKTAVHHLLEGNTRESFSVLLKYYDKWYTKGLNNRDHLEDLLIPIETSTVDANINANKILNQLEITKQECKQNQ
jgi:tRNA 2-selenouridine synthase